MAFHCPNCQTALEGTERFCRKCGTRILAEDLHEAPTRGFEQVQPGPVPPPAPAAEPSYYVPPAYVPPPESVAPAAPSYTPGAYAPAQPPKKRSMRKVFAIVALSVVGLCGVGSIFVGTQVYRATKDLDLSTDEGGFRGRYGDKEFGVSKPKSADELPEAVRPWSYPRARIESFIHGGDATHSAKVLVLSTTDEMAEIVKYYEEQAAERERVSTQSDDNHARVAFEGGAVEIQAPQGGNDRSTIVVTLEENLSEGGAPSGIGIPEPPEPPEPPPAPGND